MYVWLGQVAVYVTACSGHWSGKTRAEEWRNGDLSKDGNEGSLPDEAGLAAHVGASYHHGSQRIAMQGSIVGSHTAFFDSFQHCMPAALDVQLRRLIWADKSRAHVPASHGWLNDTHVR